MAKTWQCPRCDKMLDPRGRHVHLKSHDPEPPTDTELLYERMGDRPESSRTRFQRQGSIGLLDPLDQLPDAPVLEQSAGTFLLDPQGATIADAVSWYPVGAAPEDGAPAKFTVNHAEYRERYITKRGKVKLGPVLTAAHITQIVETVEKNRADEVIQVEYDIRECDEVMATAPEDSVRKQAARRKGQLRRRVDTLRQFIDKDKVINELEKMSRARRLAKLSPEQREAVLLVMEDRDKQLFQMIQREVLRQPAGEEPDPDLQPVGVPGEIRHNANWQGVEGEFQGKDFVDVEDE